MVATFCVTFKTCCYNHAKPPAKQPANIVCHHVKANHTKTTTISNHGSWCWYMEAASCCWYILQFCAFSSKTDNKNGST